MALTMVHLLAADLWATRHAQYRDCPDFYYGAISPDAIHIRDGSDKSHKNEIHLNNWGSPHPEDVIAYWRDHATPFDVGYGVHVLTDAQWVPRYRRLLPGILKPDGKLDIDRYYNDTFVTDFRLRDSAPRAQALLALVGRGETPDDHPLLTAYAFEKWREMTLDAYRGACPRHEPVRFIDEAYVQAFIADCIPMIDETFARAGLDDNSRK